MTNGSTRPARSGVAVMIGRSNVGKSTLLNAIVGSKVAIVTPKPQTTRMPVVGILTIPGSVNTAGVVTRKNPHLRAQIVFVDTPGVLPRAKDRLTRMMASSIHESLEGVDVVLHVVDPTRAIGDEERHAVRLVLPLAKPKLLVINKIDVPATPHREAYRELGAGFDGVAEVSALKGTHVPSLVKRVIGLLPEGEFLYPEHQLSDQPNRLWIAELIREKLFLALEQELPYSVHVEVTELEERENGVLYAAAVVYTDHERHQRMIIGKKGQSIKEVGSAARRELEGAMNRRVFLDLRVEADPRWMERYY